MNLLMIKKNAGKCWNKKSIIRKYEDTNMNDLKIKNVSSQCTL